MEKFTPNELSVPPYTPPEYTNIDELIPLIDSVVKDAESHHSDIGVGDTKSARILTINKKEVDKVLPPLADGSDLATCEVAVATLRHSLHVMLQDRRQKFILLWKQWKYLVSQLEVLGELLSGELLSGDQEELLGKVKSLLANDDVEDYLHSWFVHYKESNDELFQVAVGNLLAKQTDEVKQTILVDNNPYSVHLTNKTSLKPPVILSHDNRVRIRLPLEISSLIFSMCDLETCAILREASFFWYNLYQDYDFQQKLSLRCPWFTPGDDIRTWADCALVFAARLRTYQPVEGDITFPEGYMDTKLLVGRELKFKERLPSSFEGLQEHTIKCNKFCDKMHGKYVVTDLKSYESVNLDEEFEVTDESDCILSYSNTTLTLPPGSSVLLCENSKSGIFVYCQPYTYVFLRDKPHYKDAICVPFGAYYSEINGVIVRSVPGGFYALADFASKTFVEYPAIHEVSSKGYRSDSCEAAQPVACYNGLVWRCHTPGQVLGSFMDLQTGKQYYGNKKLFKYASWTLNEAMTTLKQCSRYPHLVLTRCNKGLILHDLKNVEVTYLVNPLRTMNIQDLYVFPGYLGDKFDVRYTDPKDDNSFDLVVGAHSDRYIYRHMFRGGYGRV